MTNEITITAEQVEKLKDFYEKRINDEARKDDTFNSGTICGLQIAAMIMGIDL